LELLFIGIFATMALVLVVYPLINPKKYVYYLDDLLGSSTEKKISYLQQKKALAYDNIKDLDFEQQMGKLADEDYSRLRNGLMDEAENIVKEIDSAKIKKDVDDVIEREVLNNRKIK
jgi:hypothetical protein